MVKSHQKHQQTAKKIDRFEAIAGRLGGRNDRCCDYNLSRYSNVLLGDFYFGSADGVEGTRVLCMNTIFQLPDFLWRMADSNHC